MNPKARQGSARVGRLPRRQRRLSYLLLGACALTGVVWFVLLDGLGWSPPQLRLWWIAHGVSGMATLLAIGGVLVHHVPGAWRNHRNRWWGGLALATLAAAVGSALLLMYGSEPMHDTVHWVHVGVGLFAMFAVPWHIVHGRR